MDINERQIDTGSGYDAPARAYRQELVEVGPGTPMGELMRRYWQPVFISEELTSDKPRRVRALGEDLILFRDRSGRPGLVHEHCAHRGTSLYYGRIEDDGIRCCYHGWKFDVKGNCLDQPCEVNRGEANRHRVRQPWYPVQERYGLVYAYMGPPEKKPVLPRWAHLEDLAPDEIIDVRSVHSYGPIDTSRYEMPPLDYNWLQAFENTMDGPHLPWLHYHHSGDQFTGLDLMPGAPLPPYANTENMVERMIMERTERGVKAGSRTTTPDGRVVLAANEAMVPNFAMISNFIDLCYFVPMDDTHYMSFLLWRCNFKGQRSDIAEMHGSKTWQQMTDDEHRRMPGDYEAQSSIGALPAHNLEHLSRGDAAIVMLRRRLEEAVKDVQEGRDPPGLIFDEDAPPLRSAGHKYVPQEGGAP